ncbi:MULTISPECIES: hypothetical protein [Pseudomonas syringae group]|nr:MULTISPECIES: hypothetical protein [Pseudomonas syringae group]
MSKISNIDTKMPITFYACRVEIVTDPEMVSLAEQMKMPRLLNCTVPLADAEIVIRESVVVMNWLSSSPRWSARIEETLQCLAEDANGRPLLTAFIPINELIMLAEDLNSDCALDLRPAFVEWQALGATEGCFDGYRLDLGTIEAVESATSELSADLNPNGLEIL